MHICGSNMVAFSILLSMQSDGKRFDVDSELNEIAEQDEEFNGKNPEQETVANATVDSQRARLNVHLNDTATSVGQGETGVKVAFDEREEETQVKVAAEHSDAEDSGDFRNDVTRPKQREFTGTCTGKPIILVIVTK